MQPQAPDRSAQPPRWLRSFPDFSPPPPAMPPGFNDTSWRDEAMPSFVNPELGLRIWVDYADPALREDPGAPRFSLARVDWDGEAGDDIVATDDWDALVDAVEAESALSPRP